MGKSKKTRWRTFEISGSQDEAQTDGADVKVNGTHSDQQVSSQKYSQILGDHHTNNSTNQFNKNSSSYSYKSRGYNNKENLNNQRSGPRSSLQQRSWQRGGAYRTSSFNSKDKKQDENGLSDGKVDIKTEPIKFNEDEYTRITTPRQDVLFKKGYLSRMNNKTANHLSATGNSIESTAASSTITTSDPDSSVSTLSPATTPSMDYGQADSMDFGQMYYPGYYDENGMLVIPMYNNYNYYPQNGSSASSPVYLMPYPYQYDPFFMTPGCVQVDGEESAEDKTETDGPKENNQNAENKNSDRSTPNSDDTSSTHGEESKDEKKENADQNGTEHSDEKILKEVKDSDGKSIYPIYPNELNGYVYPTYPNGYYNNLYYYNNGAPSSRPPKMKRRKRFISSRNSQQQQPRSAETTTDYSDEENASQNKHYNSRYQNGWAHFNGYNHYNGRIHKVHMDQNINQAPHEFHLNVDVQEFYPRVYSMNSEAEKKVNCDETSADLVQPETLKSPKSKVEVPKATKTSHSSKASTGRVSKKEIIESIKSMEQQNIDLMATKHQTTKNASQTDDWNVIKKGKKVKVVKDVKIEQTSSEMQEVKENCQEIKIEEPKVEVAITSEVMKKSLPAPKIIKKVKGKGKKKKTHLLTKQDGFQIIEPDFNTAAPTDAQENSSEVTQDFSDEEDLTEQESLPVQPENGIEIIDEKVLEIVETNFDSCPPMKQDNDVESVAQTVQTDEEKRDVPLTFKNIEDATIDISDEDVSRQINELIPELSFHEEMKPEIQESNVTKSSLLKDEMKVEVEPEVELKAEPELERESESKTQSKLKVELIIKDKQEVLVKQETTKKVASKAKVDPFQDMDFFNDDINIATLERDLMENLRLLDDDIDLKSPIINPLYDFPITSAVQKWLQEKQNESFDSLFHVQNFKKINEILEDDDEDETESDISEKDTKSESDSDYASDIQAKVNGSSPTCSSQAKSSTASKSNKLIAAKESFCALM